MQISRYFVLFLVIFGLSTSPAMAQEEEKLAFFEPADTFQARRFWPAFTLGATAYTATMVGLSQIWYADYPKSKFHFFNDWKEWEKMDKFGHAFTAYQESKTAFYILRWTGLKRRKALWISVGLATLFQSSLETFDGFSERWGFSAHDIAFNSLGTGLFLVQEWAWQEERISFKISSSGVNYPDTRIFSVDGSQSSSLQERASELYGKSLPERFIKDYNGQTLWLSVNPHSFLQPQSRFPKWLNIAVGYGAENMYGGFANNWEFEGHTFQIDPQRYPRYQQFYLSLDIDFKKLKIKNKFLRTLLGGLNLIKIPSPTLEINSLGKMKFHPIYF